MQTKTMKLPDGSLFPYWEQPCSFTKTYYVSQHHPKAADDNPGSRERPFKTINRVAQVLVAGERVLVASGVYREMIQPLNGGQGAETMISYEAAPGAKVVVKGSQILQTEWQPSIDTLGKQYSLKLWMADIPDQLFTNGISPFKMQNASVEDFALMPWAVTWSGRVPYTLCRGLVFQDGHRLVQLAVYEDLVRVPGSFWVSENGIQLHIHSSNGKNPNTALIEITTQAHLVKPVHKDLGYIRIKGFDFEHAGNGLPRTGVGAVYANGGHHWIIEDNVVRHVNSVGIEIGARTDESESGKQTDAERARSSPGCMVVRNNTVYDCGTGGIQGLLAKNALVQHNHIYQCGWQDVEQYWECAGIKLLLNQGTLVCDNHLHDIEAASGIWLDFANQNSRITGNVLVNIRNISGASGAIYIEASRVPNWVDHNILWGIRGLGICLNDTDVTVVKHNLLAYADAGVSARVNTQRVFNGRAMTSRNNRIHHNIFYKVAMPVQLGDLENVCDANVYIEAAYGFGFGQWRKLDSHLEAEDNHSGPLLERCNLNQWHEKGWDLHSAILKAVMKLDTDRWILSWESDQPLPALPSPTDAAGEGVAQRWCLPGPFKDLQETRAEIKLTQ